MPWKNVYFLCPVEDADDLEEEMMKGRSMNRVLSIALSFVLVFSLFAGINISAFANGDEETTYTINFDGNGGTGSIASITGIKKGDKVTLPECSYTRSGYTFLGWSEENTCYINPEFEEGEELNIYDGEWLFDDNDSITLYAIWWQDNEVITINFDGNDEGVSGTTESITVNPICDDGGILLPENGFCYSGHSFLGWDLNNDSTYASYAEQGEISESDFYSIVESKKTDNITLYAIWWDNTKNWKINFEANGGTGSTESISIIPIAGKSYQFPECGFSKEGYSFGGWCLKYNQEDHYHWPYAANTYEQGYHFSSTYFQDRLNEYGQMTFYPKWLDDNKTYTITFDEGSGVSSSGTPSISGFTWKDYVNIPECSISKEGYIFAGWSCSCDEGHEIFYPNDSTFKFISDSNGIYKGAEFIDCADDNGIVSLQARWFANSRPEDSKTYTVRFDSNGAVGSISQITGKGSDKIVIPTGDALTKDGYTFMGWNTSPYDDYAQYEPGVELYIDDIYYEGDESGEITLYAVWEKNRNLTFRFDGGDSVQGSMPDITGVDCKHDVTLPECGFKKDGYIFNGWKVNLTFGEYYFTDKQTIEPWMFSFIKENGGIVILTAEWIDTNENFTIAYDSNSGGDSVSGNMSDQTFKRSDNVIMPQCSYARDGYEFVGWSKGQTIPYFLYNYYSLYEAEHTYNGIDFFKGANDNRITLYAVWREKRPNWTLRFDGNGGSGTGTLIENINYDSVINLPQDYKKNGAILLKWSTSKDGTGTSFEPQDVISSYSLYNIFCDSIKYQNGEAWKKDDATLYAIWLYTNGKDCYGGHTWNTPTYTWSSNNKTCTATRVCKNNINHVETETVNTTSKVVKKATSSAKGTTEYTATFTNGAFAKQTKQVQDIPASGGGSGSGGSGGGSGSGGSGGGGSSDGGNQDKEPTPTPDPTPTPEPSEDPTPAPTPGKQEASEYTNPTTGEVILDKIAVPESDNAGTKIVKQADGSVTVTDSDLGVARSVSPAVFAEGQVYRLYNPNTGEHFYTKNPQERDSLANIGWSYEADQTTKTIASTEEGAAPVYRVYNPNSGLHHYTTDKAEALMLKSVGWNYEGISLYAYDKRFAKGAPTYRVYCPFPDANGQNQHVYTGNVGEVGALVALGYIDEGIAWRVK